MKLSAIISLSVAGTVGTTAVVVLTTITLVNKTHQVEHESEQSDFQDIRFGLNSVKLPKAQPAAATRITVENGTDKLVNYKSSPQQLFLAKNALKDKLQGEFDKFLSDAKAFPALTADLQEWVDQQLFNPNQSFFDLSAPRSNFTLSSDKKASLDFIFRFTNFTESVQLLKLPEGVSVVVDSKQSFDYYVNASAQKLLVLPLSLPDYTLGLNYMFDHITLNGKVVNKFSFNPFKTNLNLAFSNVYNGVDVFEAQKNLVGKGKYLNTHVKAEDVKKDVNANIKNQFDIAKIIAELMGKALKEFGNQQEGQPLSFLKVMDKVKEDFEKLFNLVRPGLGKFVKDLIQSSSQAENKITVYKLIFDNKKTILNLLKELSIPELNSSLGLVDVLFDVITDSDGLYERLQSFKDLIVPAVKTNEKTAALSPLIEELLTQKDTYVFDLIQKHKGILTNLLKNFLADFQKSTPFMADQVAIFTELFDNEGAFDLFGEADFVDKIAELFLTKRTVKNGEKIETKDSLLVTSLKSLLGEKVAALDDLLDSYIFKNELLNRSVEVAKAEAKDTKGATDYKKEQAKALKKLFKHIGENTLSKTNLDKITLKEVKNTENVELEETETTLKVKKLDVEYKVELGNFEIKNGLIKAMLEFLPDPKDLETTLDKLLFKGESYKAMKDKYIKEGFPGYGWAKGVVPGAFESIENTFKSAIDKTKSIRDLFGDMLFGNDLSSVKETDSFITLGGSFDIKYGGENLNVLPAYYSLINSEIGYQIIGVDTTIDATKVKVELKNKEYKGKSPAINGQVKLSQSFFNVWTNMFDSITKQIFQKKYEFKDNIQVFARNEDNTSRLELDISDPEQRVIPFAFVDGFGIQLKAVDKNITKEAGNTEPKSPVIQLYEALNKEKDQKQQSKQSPKQLDTKTQLGYLLKLGDNWSKDDYKSLIDDTIINNNYLEASFNSKITVDRLGIPIDLWLFKIWPKFNLEIPMQGSLQLYSSSVIFPYGIYDTSVQDATKIVKRLNFTDMGFKLNDPKPNFWFVGF